jgi:hypothetical protein
MHKVGGWSGPPRLPGRRLYPFSIASEVTPTDPATDTTDPTEAADIAGMVETGGRAASPDTVPRGRSYLLLLENDLNRVYSQSLDTVAAAELRWVTDGLLPTEDRLTGIERTPFGRAVGLAFTSSADEAGLTAIVAQLSCALALFGRSPGEGSMLTPIPLTEQLVYGTELATTQRYRGKTNERLTRAMLNLALSASGLSVGGPWPSTPTVLDPMCGRGTTLNWALAYGCNAIGIEPNAPSLKHHDTFLTTWARQQRLPHKHQGFRSNNAERRHTVVDIAPTRAALKAGEGQRIETFAADGGDTTLRIMKGSVDGIVADLPYGVQHRSDSARFDPTDTADLVARLAPAWRRWLRRDGAVCLAWNTRRASRPDLTAALVDAGFTVPDLLDPEQTGCSMAHRVDSTINRDVVVVVNS